MSERDFAEQVYRTCKAVLEGKLGDVLKSLDGDALRLDALARDVAQGVLSTIAIVEIDECCPICAKPIGPSFTPRVS